MIGYNPKNWYWVVAGATTQVYSSAARDYVPINDTDYVAWRGQGGVPTIIDTDNNLKVVLFQAGVLAVHITFGAVPSLTGYYSVTPDSQASINGLSTYILLNNKFPAGLSAMPWIDADGDAHAFPDVGTFKSFATAFADFLAVVLMYISSGQGSIPSTQITI